MSAVVASRLLPEVDPPGIVDDPDLLAGYLSDASGVGPGRATGLVRPRNPAEVAAALRAAAAAGQSVLPQAARSSLTGGAVPRGERLLSVEGLTGVGEIERRGAAAICRVESGVRLSELRARLEPAGWYYPPVPTYEHACVGGVCATNAGGPATFKYGVTRDWIEGLEVVLSDGTLLSLDRGEASAPRGGSIVIESPRGSRFELPVPSYRLPELKKLSAGYHAADPLDLVDLFLGSEGTLGVITAATVRLVPKPTSTLVGVAAFEAEERALDFVLDCCSAAQRTSDPVRPDVRAVEWLDRESLRLLRRRTRLLDRFPWSEGVDALLFFELESGRTDEEARVVVEEWLERGEGAGTEPLARFLSSLAEAEPRALETLQLAFPEDRRLCRELQALREAVPEQVAELLAERSRTEPGIAKVGGDLIVPRERLSEMLAFYRQGFRRRGLEFAVWGHVSDGNLHPNALPRNAAEVRAGHEALLEFAERAAALGGAPLSEHGVGRHPVKQEMLRRFLGEGAIEEMRRIKAVLDPVGLLAPGVLFP